MLRCYAVTCKYAPSGARARAREGRERIGTPSNRLFNYRHSDLPPKILGGIFFWAWSNSHKIASLLLRYQSVNSEIMSSSTLAGAFFTEQLGIVLALAGPNSGLGEPKPFCLVGLGKPPSLARVSKNVLEGIEWLVSGFPGQSPVSQWRSQAIPGQPPAPKWLAQVSQWLAQVSHESPSGHPGLSTESVNAS